MEKGMKDIYSNKSWHTWKCRCGSLNGRSRGNCSRCGFPTTIEAMFYGKDIIHNGIWSVE